MPSSELDSLVKRLADDRKAFATFYDLTSAFVFGLLLRILGNRETAEEVAQEVYVQLWRTAPTFDGRRGSALAWIAMVARSRAVDRLRADASLRNAVARSGAEPPPTAPPPNPEEEASLGERRVRLREALAALPTEQRAALELAFFEGLSHSEISQRTDTPLGTVKTRIRAAIARLEQALATLRS